MKTLRLPNTDITIALLNDACKWRGESLWTKEPATIGWLGELEPDDVLWDCGANIGLYSLFAASRGVKVVSYEPMISNLYALWENLRLNPELAKRITIAPVALSDVDEFTMLHLSSPDIGSSCHTAGPPLNYKLEKKSHWYGTQGCITMRGEAATAYLPAPTAMKIDTDGLDHLVILGMGEKIATVRTICVETNSNLKEHKDMIAYLLSVGFEWDEKQYVAAQRKDGPFIGVGEALFRRVETQGQMARPTGDKSLSGVGWDDPALHESEP